LAELYSEQMAKSMRLICWPLPGYFDRADDQPQHPVRGA
jgi:hypothetical protein